MRITHPPRRRLAGRALIAAALCAATLTPAVATANTPLTQHAASDRSDGSQHSDLGNGVVEHTTSDPNDTSGRFDIQRVQDLVDETDPRHFQVTFRIRTYRPFATAAIGGMLRNFRIDLNRTGQLGSDRQVNLTVDHHGRLKARVISTATRKVIGTVSATRPNHRTVEISGPLRLLGARSYFVMSFWHADCSGRCGSHHGTIPTAVADNVPNDGDWLPLTQRAPQHS